MASQDKIRNIAIIAHVDHGKTTLVDELLKQGGIYRENQATQDRVIPSETQWSRGIYALTKPIRSNWCVDPSTRYARSG